MTAAEFRYALAAAGVSRPWLATATGRSLSTVDHWCSGRTPAPDAVAAWLSVRMADPPPVLAPYVGTPPGRRAA